MIGNLLFSKVNVVRPVSQSGASGGVKEFITTLYTDLPCQVQGAKPVWKVQYSRRSINITHTCIFAGSPDIQNGDRILLGDRTFQVEGVRNFVELNIITAVDVLEQV